MWLYTTDRDSRTNNTANHGTDVMASAQTGSGKTAAYALPLIECLDEPEKKPRVLVLVPTRELALQVEEQFTKFAKFSQLRSVTLYGGTGYDSQTKALKRGVDIIVATPGRLYDLMERRCADLSISKSWFSMKQTDCWIWALCRKFDASSANFRRNVKH